MESAKSGIWDKRCQWGSRKEDMGLIAEEWRMGSVVFSPTRLNDGLWRFSFVFFCPLSRTFLTVHGYLYIIRYKAEHNTHHVNPQLPWSEHRIYAYLWPLFRQTGCQALLFSAPSRSPLLTLHHLSHLLVIFETPHYYATQQ